MLNKTEKNKQLLLEQLKKTPIVESACQKLGIARSTYYFWRSSDPEFAKQADEAVKDGSLLVSDLAESQLIAAIKDRNLSAIIFWLKTHHPTYKTKVEISGSVKQVREELTEEEAAMIAEALRLAGFSEDQIKINAAGENISGNETINNDQSGEVAVPDRTDQA